MQPDSTARVSPPSDSPADELAFIRSVLRAESSTLDRLADGLDATADAWHAAIELVAACDGHVVVAGMGKSGLIGAKISATLSSLGRPSHTLHPAEAVHGDLGRIRRGDVALLIGGADGLDPALRAQSDMALSFGPMVWPHMLARVMLAEQLYRATAILAGTPYHRV